MTQEGKTLRGALSLLEILHVKGAIVTFGRVVVDDVHSIQGERRRD